MKGCKFQLTKVKKTRIRFIFLFKLLYLIKILSLLSHKTLKDPVVIPDSLIIVPKVQTSYDSRYELTSIYNIPILGWSIGPIMARKDKD